MTTANEFIPNANEDRRTDGRTDGRADGRTNATYAKI